jgi:hypothetical protein
VGSESCPALLSHCFNRIPRYFKPSFFHTPPYC